MDTIPQDTPQGKQCTKCLQIFPATSDFFTRDRRNKDGFHNFCKTCLNAYHRKLRKEGPTPKVSFPDGYKLCNKCNKLFPATPEYFFRDKYTSDGFVSYCKEHSKRVRKGSIVSGMKRCSRCKQVKPATTEFFTRRPERKSGLRSICKICQSGIDATRIRPKATREASRQRYLRERDRRLKQRFNYYHGHVEQYRLYYQQYRQSHALQCKVNGHNRRARQRSAPGSHNVTDVQRQYKSQKGKCYYCFKKLSQGKKAYHVDHIIPLSRGGSNDPSNLVITCPSCNLSKKDKLPHEWPEGGRLL